MYHCKHSMGLVDQTTDKSGAVLVKIANRLADTTVGKRALDTLFGTKRTLAKTASFPSDTADDTFLSRIYFEAQKESLPEKTAGEIDKRLSVYEALHGLDYDVTLRPEQPKAPQVKLAFDLLPNCKIASENDLVQSGQDFSQKYMTLTPQERVTFASNYVKVAAEIGHAGLPDAVRIYSGTGVVANPGLADAVQLRKVAMDRRGIADSGYDVLHEQLLACDPSSYTVAELQKLAETIAYADEAFDLYGDRIGRTIPDAWHSVFKLAEDNEQTRQARAEGMSKADIISRYGEGILEEIEDATGNIDTTKLNKIMEAMGDSASGPSDDDDRTTIFSKAE